jgi:hypothetical protein
MIGDRNLGCSARQGTREEEEAINGRALIDLTREEPFETIAPLLQRAVGIPKRRDGEQAASRQSR